MLDTGAIGDLRRRFHGALIQPADAEYDQARRVWNAMINRRPALIARCAGAQDVVQAVRFARDKEMLVAVRGGGHNVAGNGVCDGGLVIDLSQMKTVQVDAPRRTAQAQPGLTLGEFDRVTQGFELATTLGEVSTTGISGLTLGGGLGWLMGEYGLACDNVESVDIVTADSQTRTASESENPDLFWAVRGGGGNFGVVTSLRYRLHPVGPVLGGMVIHPFSRAKDVLRFYREFVARSPDALTVGAGILSGPDGNLVVALPLCYCGPLDKGEKLVEPLRKFGPPAVDLIGPKSYLEVQATFDAAFPPGHHNYWRGGFANALSDDLIDALIEHVPGRPSPLSFAVVDHVHGAALRVPSAATAFPHRSEPFHLLAFAIWSDAAASEKNVAWAQKLWSAVEPRTRGHVTVNFLGQEGDERVRAAYGPNYQRLVEVKEKYDPSNFFRVNQNIRPRTTTPAG